MEAVRHLLDDGPSASWTAPWLRRAVVLLALAMIVATWPLWTPQTDFPQAPLLVATDWPDIASWVLLVGLLGSLAGSLGAETSNVTKLSLCGVAGCWLALALGDQQRLTPWAWQMSLLAVILAADNARTKMQLARGVLVAIYLASAVSKFHYAFLAGPGTTFARVLVAGVGFAVDPWCAAWTFPLGELAVAVGLLVPPSFWTMRAVALGGALLMHLLLLAILGPWGLDNQPGVLLWNVSSMLQAALLFGPALWHSAEADGQEPELGAAPAAAATPPPSWSDRAALVALAAALLPPVINLWGGVDPWFAWELYSPRGERAAVFVRAEAAQRLPPEYRDEAAMAAGDYWVPMRLDRASLAILGTPLYPSPRVHLAVAIAVARRYDLGSSLRVDLLSAADRWDGSRSRRELLGLDQVRQSTSARPGARYPRPSD